MDQIKVIKLSKNENTFVTPLDQCDLLPSKPKPGEILILLSSNPDYHGVVTSLVKSVKKLSDGWEVETRNSIYKITLCGYSDDPEKQSSQ